MGTLTKDELVAEVASNLGNPSNMTTRIVRHLDLAQEQLATRFPFRDLNRRDVVQINPLGDPAFDKLHVFTGVKLRNIKSLTRIVPDEKPFPLTGLPDRQWAKLIGETEEFEPGDPTHYNEFQVGTIDFWRVPNRAFSLLRKYTIWPTPLVSVDGAVPSVFEQKDEILIQLATSSLFHSRGMTTQGDKAFGIAADRIKKAIADDQERPDVDTVPRGISASGVPRGDYVTDPFQRRAP